jgi:CRP-like cAMP-binding protein
MDLDRAPRLERASAEPTLEFALEGDEPAGADRPEIGASPLFSDFSTDELLAVMRGFRLVSFEPGDILVTEGAPGDSLFVLTTGSVKAFVRDAEGNNHVVRQMSEGAFFGEVSVLTGKARTATVVAASPCELLELDRRTLDGIAGAHPRVLEVLKTFSAMRLGSATETEARAKAG